MPQVSMPRGQSPVSLTPELAPGDLGGAVVA
jgi:hypothetical protein